MFPDWSEDFGQEQVPEWSQCINRPNEINHNLTTPLPEGENGRFDLLSVEDVKFLIACGIDPLS